MRRIVERLNAALACRPAGWWLLALLGAAYGVAHFQHPLFPGSAAGAAMRGWWTWTDQSRYLAEAAAIATGTLDAGSYHYPIGYPALGALFWRWRPLDPFFVPDLLLVLAAAAVWWRLALRWLSRLDAVLVGVLFLVTHRWLITYTQLVPWNTLASQAALLAGIWLVTAKAGPRALWCLSLLAAATYAVRPIDAVAFLPLLILGTLRLGTWRARLLHGTGGALLVAATVIAIGWLNLGVFGEWRSPYETVSTQRIGFFGYPVSYKFFWLFVDGQPLFREVEPALLFRYPWLWLALPAVIFWWRREGIAAVAGAASLGLNWLLYVNYNDLLPSDIYRFTLIHYLAWGFPLLFVLTAAACRHGWRDRWVRVGFAGAAAAMIVGVGLQMQEQRLDVPRTAEGEWQLPSARPLLIRFAGLPMERVTDLRLEDRPLTEYSEYLGPYVASDLQILLGTRTVGTRLTAAPGSRTSGATLEAARYTWRWRWDGERWKQGFAVSRQTL